MSDPVGMLVPVDEGSMRVCTGCLTTVPPDRFPSRGRRCLDCRRAQVRDHYRRNRAYYIAKARRRNTRVILEVRAWLCDYLSTHPCVDCENDDVRVLEFDHRDPSRKTREVSELARDGYSLERVRAEIALCDVRCANCHRIRTHHQRGWWGSLVESAPVTPTDSTTKGPTPKE